MRDENSREKSRLAPEGHEPQTGNKSESAPRIRPVGLDHIVLCVADVERSLAFYCDTLGLDAMRVDEWRSGKVRFPSVRVNAQTIIDLAHGERNGMNVDHFCLVIEPIDFDALLASEDVTIERGPAMRSGAQGDGLSIYLRDPDANLVELRYYQ